MVAAVKHLLSCAQDSDAGVILYVATMRHTLENYDSQKVTNRRLESRGSPPRPMSDFCWLMLY